MQKCWRQHRDNKSRPDTVILKWTWLEPASFTLLRPRRIRIHWPVVQRRTRAKYLHPQENGWICSDVLCLSVTTQNQTDNAKPQLAQDDSLLPPGERRVTEELILMFQAGKMFYWVDILLHRILSNSQPSTNMTEKFNLFLAETKSRVDDFRDDLISIAFQCEIDYLD